MIFYYFFFFSVLANSSKNEMPCNQIIEQKQCDNYSSCYWEQNQCIEFDNCLQLISLEHCQQHLNCVFYQEKCQKFMTCSSYMGTKQECERITSRCTSEDQKICTERILDISCTRDSENCQMIKDSVNVMVLGKTGVGKSYFLNQLIQEPKPQTGIFTVFDSVNSGTQECQVETNKFITYGEKQEKSLNLNVMDAPGLFDTEDTYQNWSYNETKPPSIMILKLLFIFFILLTQKQVQKVLHFSLSLIEFF